MKREQTYLTPNQVWDHPVLHHLIELSQRPLSFNEYAQRFPWIKFGAVFWKEEESCYFEIEADGLTNNCIGAFTISINGYHWMAERDNERKVILIRSIPFNKAKL